ETPYKGVGMFTFTIKKGDAASSQQSISKTWPTSSNIQGKIALDKLSSRAIERRLVNHLNLTSDSDNRSLKTN
ncbi:MAG: hypothetical protein LUP95_05875, partial [Euryarchaeota archaeon]|nr:hypothetical protein [Euryarchaeota archaeon]